MADLGMQTNTLRSYRAHAAANFSFDQVITRGDIAVAATMMAAATSAAAAATVTAADFY